MKVIDLSRHNRLSDLARIVMTGVMSAFPAQPWGEPTVAAWGERIDASGIAREDWIAGLRVVVDTHRGGPVQFGDLNEAARDARRQRCSPHRPIEEEGPKRIAARSRRNPDYPRAAMEIVDAILAKRVRPEDASREFDRRIRENIDRINR